MLGIFFGTVTEATSSAGGSSYGAPSSSQQEICSTFSSIGAKIEIIGHYRLLFRAAYSARGPLVQSCESQVPPMPVKRLRDLHAKELANEIMV